MEKMFVPLRYINDSNKNPAARLSIAPIFKTRISPILSVRFPAKNDADAYKIVKELQTKPNPVLSMPKSLEKTVEPTAKIAKKLPVVNP